MAPKYAPLGRSLHIGPFEPRNVLIYGTGAVGAVVGWRLAQLPHVRVSVVCRSNYDAVNARGFQMSTLKWGSGHFMPHFVYRHPTEVLDREGPFDYVLCANKMTPGKDKPYRDLRAVVSEKTTLVSFQNGIDVEAPLRQAFPNNTLISSIVYFSCRQLKPGVVAQEASIRPYIAGLALYDRRHGEAGATDDSNFADFTHLGQGEFQCLNSLVTDRWSKQLWNGAFNPLCAIFGLDTHQLLRGSELSRKIVAKVMEETYNVAIAAGAIIDPATSQRLIEVTESSPPIVPSMLQDVRANRAMEVETLSGNVWRLGTKLGVDVSTLKNVYEELVQVNHSLEQGV